ncbi:glutamyl-tRNA reductase [Cuniculiplasma sp. SKW3]|uniref:glutamyl-tRNA reductase n=1 Tax=unclassified Cuniculiplasma TaxID=2619706 RepID=UPI003FD38941
MLVSDLKVIMWDFRGGDNSLEKVLKLDDDEIQSRLSTKNVEKRIILRTCNRLEIYYDADVVFDDENIFPGSKFLRGDAAIMHILRVSAGLESMSVGENEILRQIKEAMEKSIKEGRSNKFLSMIFHRAIKLGKEIREKTEISHGKVSIPSIMIDQIGKRGLINGKHIGIVGTGKMAATIVKYLKKEENAIITIYGRNEEAGKELADLFGVNFRKTLDIPIIIDESDVIITATTSKTVLIDKGEIEKINKKILLVDISNPKNIDENFINPTVELLNLDMANQIMEENRKRKEKDIVLAEEIIKKELDKIYTKIAEGEIEWYISDIYGKAREILNEEIIKYNSALEAGHDPNETLLAMGNSFINKILAPQTLTLKRMIREGKTESVRDFLDSVWDITDDDPDQKDFFSEDPKDTQNQQARSHQLSQMP